jgi:CubicO group peptidase (beta-lactamase class C family)
MHAALRRHVESGVLPGLVALVSHRGREHVETIGTMAFDSDVPMRRDTIFRLASMTKPVTAVAAMILVEECQLRLDDPVDEWLPELADRQVLRTLESSLDDTVPAKRPITLRDLLTFRSGYGELGFVAPTSPLLRAMMEARLTLAEWPFQVTPDEFMKRLGSLPLAHQPGERWLYHTGSEILGVLIARVSGQSLATFAAGDAGHWFLGTAGAAPSAPDLLRDGHGHWRACCLA